MPKFRTARSLTGDLLQHQFNLIVDAALKNERCPVCEPYGPIIEHALKRMRDQKWIEWKISHRGWRQVTILAGPHKGKMTAPNPYGTAAWKDRQGETDGAAGQRPEDLGAVGSAPVDP